MRKSPRSTLGLLAGLTCPLHLQAQLDTTRGGSTLVPIPAVFYQPETGTAFGAVLGYFVPAGGDGAGGSPHTSSLLVSAIYTTRKQVLTGVNFEVFPNAAQYWIRGSMEYQLFPTKFWGVGHTTPDDAEEDYTPRRLQFAIDVQRRVAPGWYAGVTALVKHRTLPVVDAGGLLDGATVPGTEPIDVAGAGVLVTADTRDRVVDPRHGSLHALRVVAHPGGLVNDYGFTQVTLDLRTYLPLADGHVLAWRALGIATAGQPPFDHLPELGGDVLLRGYYQGRYRDRQLLALEADYRFPLAWIVRGVAFGGAGQVADRLGDFEPDRFHLNAGLGLRFVLDRTEGLSIRMDYAWGFAANSSGLYFGLGEAF